MRCHARGATSARFGPFPGLLLEEVFAGSPPAGRVVVNAPKLPGKSVKSGVSAQARQRLAAVGAESGRLRLTCKIQ
jgi:hypothetical protein